MRRATGFTLRELVVVILSAALVIGVLVPAGIAVAARDNQKASCMSNLKGIGTALALYANNNDNAYPMIPGSGWDNVADGSNYLSDKGSPFPAAKPDGDWAKQRSVTSLIFMLVRNGEAPKLFICPSDGNAKADTSMTNAADNGAFNWDFTGDSKRHCSYSYQCPITRGAAKTDRNGIPATPDDNMVVLSDRTPAAKGDKFTGAAGSPGAWSANIAKDKWHFYNSQNHKGGESMNVLYVDGRAAQTKSPNCGATLTGTKNPDCIFNTVAGAPAAADGSAGVDYGGAVDNTKHAAAKDSYLFGSGGK